MSDLIAAALPQFAPTTHLYRLDDGRHVLICVPDDLFEVPPEIAAPGVEHVAPSPTLVFLADEHGVVIDADGDPCNGLTALAQYPTGTTHTQALDLLEGDQ